MKGLINCTSMNTRNEDKIGFCSGLLSAKLKFTSLLKTDAGQFEIQERYKMLILLKILRNFIPALKC